MGVCDCKYLVYIVLFSRAASFSSFVFACARFPSATFTSDKRAGAVQGFLRILSGCR
jgi:hypothetical protein